MHWTNPSQGSQQGRFIMEAERKKKFVIIIGSVSLILIILTISGLTYSWFRSSSSSEPILKPAIRKTDSATARKGPIKKLTFVLDDFSTNLYGSGGHEVLTVKSKLTWKEFSEQLSTGNKGLCKKFANLFKSDPEWLGVYLESKPFTKHSAESQTVEFKIIRDDMSFKHMVEDKNGFKDKFDKFCKSGVESVIDFYSRYPENYLISPCPYSEKTGINRAHIKAFFQTASDQEITNLCIKIGQKLLDAINENSNKGIWLSTHGGGVSWLHVRIYRSPDYYHTNEYKTVN